MLDFQAGHHQMLRAEAVSAALPSGQAYAALDRCWDSTAYHELLAQRRL